MTAVEELILFGVGMLLLVGVIRYASVMSDTGGSLANNVNSSFVKTNAALTSSDVTKYDGLTVSGADVTNAVKRFPIDGVRVTVETKNKKANGTNQSTVDDLTKIYINPEIDTITADNVCSYKDIPDITAADYINPAADFVCKVSTDTTSGSVTTMTFSQSEATFVAKANSNTGGSGSSGGTGSNGNISLDDSTIASLNTALNTVAASLQTVSTQLTTILNGAGSGGLTPGDTSSIAKSISDLQTSITNMSTQMQTNDSKLETKIDSLTGTVNNLQSAVSAIKLSVDGLSASITSNSIGQSDVSQLKQSITDLRSAMTTLQSSVNKNSTEISKLNSSVLNENNSSSVSSRVKKLEGDITDMGTQLNTLLEKVDTIQRQLGTGG